jgi:hypothetical protein
MTKKTLTHRGVKIAKNAVATPSKNDGKFLPTAVQKWRKKTVALRHKNDGETPPHQGTKTTNLKTPFTPRCKNDEKVLSHRGTKMPKNAVATR